MDTIQATHFTEFALPLGEWGTSTQTVLHVGNAVVTLQIALSNEPKFKIIHETHLAPIFHILKLDTIGQPRLCCKPECDVLSILEVWDGERSCERCLGARVIFRHQNATVLHDKVPLVQHTVVNVGVVLRVNKGPVDGCCLCVWASKLRHARLKLSLNVYQVINVHASLRKLVALLDLFR
jgi:hypothetical protein